MVTDDSASSPLIPPYPIVKPSEIDLESGPDEQIQCRICFETKGRDFIAPCKCKGTSKYVHRKCLDHWRAVKEGFAFGHCTTCMAPYYLRVHTAHLKWRTLKFQFFVTRDVLFVLLAMQLVIASLAYLVYLIDGYEKFWLRLTCGFGNILAFYYICGALLFFALLAVSGCFIMCNNENVFNNLDQQCQESCLCCCDHGFSFGHLLCDDCRVCDAPHFSYDCARCIDGCAGTNGECCCLQRDGESGLPCLIVTAFVMLLLFAVFGIFFSVLVATMVGQRIWQRHHHILTKRMLTKVSQYYILFSLVF
ncbi:zinc finger [Olea europaea subsp. europaea]|uniref:Zinc finger n=1 Tax=Olea europaea subsp. europaea TaxID=158383 RepID=A0A8S0V4K0_OLEEU|nr:zinc finger [Olea europaea subsp. europaea]